VSAPSSYMSISLQGEDNIHYTKTESDSNGMMSFVYTFTNIPERPTDEYLLPNAIASMTFCTALEESSLVGKIANQNSMQKFDNKKITDFFFNRLTGEMDDMEKILKVRDYIHDYIRTNDVEAEVLNYMFASPQTVWESNCALPIEKNILLAGVLQSLGYDARLAFHSDALTADLKTVVRILLSGGKTYYISANESEELSLDAFFAPATLILQNGSIEKVEAQPTSVKVSALIVFENGISDNPTVGIAYKDVQSPMTKTLQPQEINVAKVSVSQLSGKYYEMTIDDGNYGTQVRSVNIHNDRQYDVDTKESDESYIYIITLPDNVRCLTKPMQKEITVENAKMLVDIQVDGRTVTINRHLLLPQEGISAKNVKKFKAMMGEWEAPVKIVVSTL